MRLFISLLVAIVMFFVLSNSKLFAQDQQLSFNVGYPIPVGDTFYSSYDGIISLDLNYTRSVSELYNINGQIGYTRSNVSFDRFPDEGISTTYANIYRFIVGPSIDVNLTNQISFVPELGIGYAYIRFTNDDVEDLTESGINTMVKFSIEHQFSQKFGLGIFSSYNFIYLDDPNNALNTRFSREMHSIDAGIKIVYSL